MATCCIVFHHSGWQQSGIKANCRCGFGVEAQTGQLGLEGLHSDTSTIRVSSPLIGHCGRCEISLHPSLLKTCRKHWTQNTSDAKYCSLPCRGGAPVANCLLRSDRWLSYGQTIALLLYSVLFFNLSVAESCWSRCDTWFRPDCRSCIRFALRSISWCSKLGQNRKGHRVWVNKTKGQSL